MCRCTQSDSLRRFNITTTVYDIQWDLFAFAGYSTASELGGGAIVVAFRGTDSHSLYNWVENMRYWKTDYDIPYPGSEGALVHTGQYMIEVAPCCLMHSSPTATIPAVRLAKSSSCALCVDSLLLLTTTLLASPTQHGSSAQVCLCHAQVKQTTLQGIQACRTLVAFAKNDFACASQASSCRTMLESCPSQRIKFARHPSLQTFVKLNLHLLFRLLHVIQCQ